MRLSIVMLLSGLSICAFTTQAAGSTPEKSVVDFYYKYLDDSLLAESEEIIDEYVSPTLIKNIDKSSQCNYADTEEDEKVCSKVCKGGACQYGGIWVETDVNYFTKSQDVCEDWQRHISSKLLSKNSTTARVELTLGVAPETKVMYSVTLINDNGNWKIWRVNR